MISTDEAELYTDEHNAAELRKAGADGTLGSWLKAHLVALGDGDYVALLAYIERNETIIDALQKMRLAVRDARHVATCAGFGPRFLHSTGQAYKGGAEQRRVPADHRRRRRGSAGARPEGQLRHDQGGAGARRFRRADRARPSRVARPSQGRPRSGAGGARCRDFRSASN